MESHEVKNNSFLLSDIFINNWFKNNQLNTEFIDFSREVVPELIGENKPFIQRLFALDSYFDEWNVQRRYEQISIILNGILERRIINKDIVSITMQEDIFIKYFSFLISMLNGEFKFYFENELKNYRIFDLFSSDTKPEIKRYILKMVEYILFNMYDNLFIKRPFIELTEFVYNTNTNFTQYEFDKKIRITEKDYRDEDFIYLDFYFQNYLNNTFLKFFKLTNNEFILSNKTIASFIDDTTKITILSIMVLVPNFAIGIVNMGPGKGSFRPIYKNFKANVTNTAALQTYLLPENKINSEGVFVNDEIRNKFKKIIIDPVQLELINACLTYSNLKYDVVDFLNR